MMIFEDAFQIPRAEDAEQAVIGGLCLDNDAIDRIGVLQPADFFNEENRRIYSTVLSLIQRQEPADLITITTADPSINMEYLHQIIQSTPSAANVGHYAGVVREKALMRGVLAATNKIQQIVHEPGKRAAEILDAAQSELSALADTATSKEPVPITEAMVRYIDLLDDRVHGRAENLGMQTGFSDLDDILNGGLRRGALITLGARPGMGKAQPLTSSVLLADGRFKEMGSISIGDALASVDGRPSFVTGVFPQGVRPIFRISTKDGRSVEADADHLWCIESSRWRGEKVVTTRELAGILTKKRYQGRVRLAQHNGDFGSESDFGIDPWLLGFLIGDGGFSSGGIRFSTAEQYILDRVSSAGAGNIVPNGGSGYCFGLTTDRGAANPTLSAIKNLGLQGKLSHEKSIDERVFLADKATRMDVLIGLLESDGWVEKCGAVRFSTASEALADGVVRLVQSLGGCATKNLRTGVFYTKEGQGRMPGKDAYQLSIALDSLVDLVRSPRLLSNLRKREMPCAPYIESVDFVRMDEAQCITVSHESRLYITDGYLVTHNSAIGESIACNMSRDYSVLFLSMEMPEAEVTERAIANWGKVSASKLASAKGLSKEDWDRTTHAALTAQKSKLFIDDEPGLTLLDVTLKARQVKRKHGLDVLVLDYLQLMTGSEEKRYQQIEAITKGLKILAKSLNIAVLALSQFSREIEKRPNPMPKLSDFRDSGSIEQDSDVLFGLYRPEMDNQNDPSLKGYAQLYVLKNRQGKTGEVPLTYLGDYMRFENHVGEVPNMRETGKKSRGIDF